jgi:hypothetical protein
VQLVTTFFGLLVPFIAFTGRMRIADGAERRWQALLVILGKSYCRHAF